MKKDQRAATDLAIKNMGGPIRIAEKFGISPQAIGHWPKRGVPLKWLKTVALDSRVARERLRPDLYV